MKRSLALLGLFLPAIDGSAYLSQHHVRPAKRIVSYENSDIPLFTRDHYEQEESKTPRSTGIGFLLDEDPLWFVQADAVHEHPDHVLEHLLHNVTVEDDGGVAERKGFSLHQNVFSSLSSLRRAVSMKPTQTTNGNLPLRVTLETNASTYSGKDFENSSKYNSSNSGTLYQVSATANVTSDSTPSRVRRRFRPLRMRSYLSDIEGGGQYLSSYERSILLQSIIKPAMLAWSAALRVHPVQGNLTVDPQQLVDGQLCGPGGDHPSITVPKDHLTIGVPNTDFILYVSLAFASNETNITAATDLENFGNSTSRNESNASDVDSTNSSFSFDLTSNSSDPSFIVENEKPQCHGDYLAASAFCSTDQFDRPTAAILHLCIDSDFFNAKKVQRNIRLVSHELGHALGFNIVSLAHFRRPDGSPYTERDSVTGEIPISEVNCTGPVGQFRTGMVALPSSEILQFRIVRGGVRVAEVVTPSVRQVARNHFDCQSLPGAELESGEFLPLSRYPGEISCLGDHWERRLFKTDLMNPLLDDSVEFTARFSTITLAYFADSGWYQVDLSRASLSAGWGRAAGCDFIEQTCVQADDGQVPANFNPFFCNQISSDTGEDGFLSEIHGCTTDLTRKASCSLDQYDGELPPSYQYFNYSYGSNIGGADPFMDYCPVYSGFTNGLCSESENEALIKVNFIERFGQRNSRCLAGHVSRTVSSGYANNSSEFGSSGPSSSAVLESTALCLPIACVVEDRTLRIQVNGVWKVCSHRDELIVPLPSTSFYTRKESQSANDVASVVCPDPIRVCPTFFCQRDCLGTNRICDYNVGQCVCGSSVNTTFPSDYVSWNETSFINSNVSTDTSPINQTDLEICMMSNASAGNFDSFYEPNPPVGAGELPNPDSPLSDYYYKTERNLKQESSSQFWTRLRKSTVSSAGVFALLIVIVFSSYVVYRRRQIVEGDDDSDPDGNNGSSIPEEAINPNKDKLMASVVVNLRMRDPALQGAYRGDPLANRDSETDLSMTDTEGTSEIPGSLDFSLESFPPSQHYSGTFVDLSAFDNAEPTLVTGRAGLYDDVDCIYIDPLAPPTAAPFKPVVRRRRHMFSGQFN